MRKIKYAIIGFGGIAENRIAREGFGLDRSRFAGHARAELVGVADTNAARREAAAGLGLRWYDSADAVMDDPDIEAVFVATNNAAHAVVAEKAIAAGKHCLIEKPIATTLEDARHLQQLARDRNVSLAVDHMMTENAYNHRAKELIEQGAVGQINDISLHMEFCYGSTPGEAASWRCADRKEIGGPIGDVASHCLYMAEFLLGSKVASLGCVYTPRTLDIAAENGALVQFGLRSGVQGTIRVAFNQPRGGLESTLTNLGYEIYGSAGIMRGCGTLFQLSGHPGEVIDVRLEVDDFQRTERIRIDAVQNIYQAVIARHAASIIDNAPLDAADAVHNLELVLACYASADQQGRLMEFK
ncbi:MAG: Gfo/Idh/MocA family oxidoreductase [Sedimentisphaerales bacterium]|nr:Gfo/Idh/MocA family oxidoreductase [Sedimentisphaerales bacterium]